MLFKLGLFMLILFGFHALIEYCSGGYSNGNENCKFYWTHNRSIWVSDNSLHDSKTNK